MTLIQRLMPATGLAVLGLLLPASILQAQDLTATEAALYEAAQSENGVTWYTSQLTTEQAEQVCALFSERYEGVGCFPVRANGSSTLQRVVQEIQAGAVQGDVVSTNGVSDFEEFKSLGGLAQYRPENLSGMEPSLAALNDSDGYYFVSGTSPFGFVYNTEIVAPEDVPTSWNDLTDPRWRDQIAIAHPGFSGSAGQWAIAMDRLYGEAFFQGLAANDPQIGRSIADGYTLVTTGERSLTVTSLALGRDAMRDGKPVDLVVPEEGMFLPPSAAAVLADAPNPNSARLFAEFLASAEFSEWLASMGRNPLRTDVSTPEGVPDLTEVNVITVSVAESLENQQRVVEMFRDIFGI
ncbi:extracellular solute-binding protein [Rhodobacter sp. NTK016B]|uniref:ABC transporter substrate-binding protein n=1 Tax=Rhodobacter sp. NTK016B TaxID=2759676 RepID=UPI001A8F5138|nr:extracellular solute-binding protein [Rhodobacter sp. NTK016B]MBN8294370.1 extracellular solute-binding protein [Rhodobacter sp. NTK016B]